MLFRSELSFRPFKCLHHIVGLLPDLLGIARSSKLWYVRSLPYGYIFFFRGTPLLIQLFLVYYGLGQFEAVRESVLWPYLRDPFWCAVLTMTLHTAAYIAEILRGAIQAIPPGEIEAARARRATSRASSSAARPNWNSWEGPCALSL